MGFQPGNQEAKKGEKKKRFKQQLIAALEDVPEGDVSKLRLIADKLIDAALGGDVQAIREIRDTVDGKPAQSIVGGDEDDAPIRLETIRRVIVRPGHSDGGGVPPAAEPGSV
jgi:hypothetical protein